MISLPFIYIQDCAPDGYPTYAYAVEHRITRPLRRTQRARLIAKARRAAVALTGDPKALTYTAVITTNCERTQDIVHVSAATVPLYTATRCRPYSI
jgi:hypothetical protein